MTDTINDTAPTEVPPAVVEAAEAARERTPDGAPRFSLLELVDGALKTERLHLKLAEGRAASAWEELDEALVEQEYSKDAIAQLEQTRAQIEREQAGATAEARS
jgi:hypothetical protein